MGTGAGVGSLLPGPRPRPAWQIVWLAASGFTVLGQGAISLRSPVLPSRGQQALPATPQTPAERIRAHVNQALQEREAAVELANSQVPSLSAHPTEVSPWLELTRWPEYLRGQDLTAVALLGNLFHKPWTTMGMVGLGCSF
jgi:hypothetical protein